MNEFNYYKLSPVFYNNFSQSNYPELLMKTNRPYFFLIIDINNFKFAIPLRTNIRHKYCFRTNPNSLSGLDYSKSILISNLSFINKNDTIKIDSSEHRSIQLNKFVIKKEFTKYVDTYIKNIKLLDSKININTDRKNKMLQYCKCSTLQYFHNELKIQDKSLDQIINNSSKNNSTNEYKENKKTSLLTRINNKKNDINNPEIKNSSIKQSKDFSL